MAKIGIALGGGGVRGLAHVGVLKVLEEEGIPISCIAGASAGAIVGAAYAQTPHAKELFLRFRKTIDKFEFYEDVERTCAIEQEAGGSKESIWKQISNAVRQRVLINMVQSKSELYPIEPMVDVIKYLVKEGSIEESLIPLAIVALDLHSGNGVALTSGDVIKAVTASSSVTGYLAPVEYEGMLLTDGGSIAPVPVEYLPMLGANISIGVDITYTKSCRLSNCSIMNTVLRVDIHRSRKISELVMRLADVQIQPDVQYIHWSEFSRFEECYEAGIKAARKAIPAIREAIRIFDLNNAVTSGRKKWWQRLLSYSEDAESKEG